MDMVYVPGNMNREPGDVLQHRKWDLSQFLKSAVSPTKLFVEVPQRNIGHTFLRMTVISILDLCNN